MFFLIKNPAPYPNRSGIIYAGKFFTISPHEILVWTLANCHQVCCIKKYEKHRLNNFHRKRATFVVNSPTTIIGVTTDFNASAQTAAIHVVLNVCWQCGYSGQDISSAGCPSSFFPPWTHKCPLSDSFCANRLPHTWQSYFPFPSPWCDSMWPTRLRLRLKPRPQIEHQNLIFG